MSMYEFLKMRLVTEQEINRMMNDKIDTSVVPLLSDGELARYLSKFGDRVALRHFCKQQSTNQASFHKEKNVKDETLCDRLMQKVNGKFSISYDGSSLPLKKIKMTKNKNAMKDRRTVQFGWKIFDQRTGEKRQIKSPKGGGVCKVVVSKTFGVKELISIGKDLFFPGGEAAYFGSVSKFNFDIEDHQEVPMGEKTIEQLHERTQMCQLRIYLVCSPMTDCSIGEDLLPDLNHRISESEVSPYLLKNVPSTCEPSSFSESEADVKFCDLALETETRMSKSKSDQPDYESIVQCTSISNESCNFSNRSGTNAHVSNISEFLVFGNSNVDDKVVLDDTVQCTSLKNESVMIRVHHEDPFNDLLNAFSNENVLQKIVTIQRVLPDGSFEKDDFEGVTIDVITDFWSLFYDECTEGNDVRVPVLRHDLTDKWASVARIIAFGWREFKYLPVKLPKSIFTYCLWDKLHVEDLMSAFLRMVTSDEQVLLVDALRDFSAVDKEDLKEVLSNLNYRKKPNAHNIKTILEEIAHTEVFQKPKYVYDCWIHILKASVLLTPDELDKVYAQLLPTCKKM